MSTEAPRSPALYRLLAWLSPAFPIGAFSYSHGLEAAVADGAVGDRAGLQGWIAALVAHGSGRVDADILRDAYRAAAAGDTAALEAANRRGAAYRATAELALESAQQGAAFLKTFVAAWADPHPNPDPPPPAGEGQDTAPSANSSPFLWESAVSAILNPPPQAGEGKAGAAFAESACHAAVFGAVAARAGITLEDALTGYLQAFAGNFVSAGLRLGVIGQTDGQRILAALEPVVARAAAAATSRDPADFGAATFAADLASMAHETQYSRLFRS
ncbi:MAG TPA: urease accessory protein UreF [Stellaceae bacterium]|nr:urease accessory protein UreF [Stellaceae bacterium]